MKTISGFLLVLGVSAPLASAQPAAAKQMRDAATHEQLALVYRQASQQDPMRNMQPAKGVDPSTANRPESLQSRSDILCFNGLATIVPKRAILNLPANLKNRMQFLPGSKLVNWMDFYALNRGWISTVEVSRAQAEGNQAMKEEIVTRIGKSSNLVVATYLGGPISVLPLKVPAENATDKAR